MIDWNKFNEYLGYYDDSLKLEVIEMFINNSPAMITALRKNVEQKDFPQLDINAHTLKSNCKTFGSVEATRLALKLELMGKDKSDEDMAGVLLQLEQEIDQLIIELKLYRSKLSS